MNFKSTKKGQHLLTLSKFIYARLFYISTFFYDIIFC